MVERYVLPEQATAEREFMPGDCWWRFRASYNVYCPQYVPAVRLYSGRLEGVMMRWGFVPAAAEGKPGEKEVPWIGAELAEQGADYRGAWLNSQRCILPAAGYYVWQLTLQRFRQPFYVRVRDRASFGFAAIWDRSVTEDDDVVESCAILTLPANDLVAGLDNVEKRMPAILRRKDYHSWLTGTPVRARNALAPYPAEWMEAYPVSPRVNSIKHNDPTLIRPLS